MLNELVADLETAVAEGRQDRRVQILRQVTDLFLVGAAGFNDEQVDLFDDVLTHLTQQVESKVLAELGARLAPIDNAPNAIIQRLARHDEIIVAGPVLAGSSRLTDADLIEIAQTKGQGHLGAISERSRLASAVTDILVERGDTTVVRKLSSNRGASFSRAGFSTLARRAEDDAELAANLGGRIDVPPDVLHQLMEKATAAVRARLLTVVPPEGQSYVQTVLADVSERVTEAAARPRDFRRAEALIADMKELGQLDETAVANFARAGQYEEMVAGLAALGGAPIAMVEPLVQNPAYDSLLILCKAAGIHWPVFCAILSHRFARSRPSAAELETARSDFLKLSSATAQRIFRFWCVRGVSKVGHA